MRESKSRALTNLATPQPKTSASGGSTAPCSELPMQRRLDDATHNPRAHADRTLLDQCRARVAGCDGREHAATRSAQPRLAAAAEPFERSCDTRKARARHGLERIARDDTGNK